MRCVSASPNAGTRAGFATALCVLIFVMVLSGGLVGGTRAATLQTPSRDERTSFRPNTYLAALVDQLSHNIATVQVQPPADRLGCSSLVPICGGAHAARAPGADCACARSDAVDAAGASRLVASPRCCSAYRGAGRRATRGPLSCCPHWRWWARMDCAGAAGSAPTSARKTRPPIDHPIRSDAARRPASATTSSAWRNRSPRYELGSRIQVRSVSPVSHAYARYSTVLSSASSRVRPARNVHGTRACATHALLPQRSRE